LIFNNLKNSRLRVLACAFACSPAGSKGLGDGEAVLGWNIVRQLARFHEVVVLTHPWNREAIERSQEALGPNVQFCYFDAPRAVRFLRRWQGAFQVYAYLWQVKAYFVARRLHRERPFDVFHHVTYANDWMASYIGALLPVPYVRGPGGGAQRTPRAFLKEYRLRDRLWERLRSAMRIVLRSDPFFILGQHRARAILVCNRESMEALPARWRKKACHFPVNGVTSEDLSHARTKHKDEGTFRVFSAGKLLHWKGFGLVIRSFSRFAAKHPGAELAIAGDGPEFPRLKALVHEFGVENKVRFERWLPRQEVISRMRASDVFLYGSLREGGGAIVVEAMAAGLPVVCLDLSGPAIHVADGCGIKIKAETYEQVVADMAAALERLYTGPELRRRMGTEARKRAEQVYHWDRQGERLLSIYQTALNPDSAANHAEEANAFAEKV
jgi:glycosyltransferase involved in cell wall biosynthesis